MEISRKSTEQKSDVYLCILLLASCRMKHAQFAVVLVTILLIACVTPETDSGDEEWKSLGNPQNRNLFYNILQSYFNGRGINLVGMGRKDKLLGNLGGKISSNYDRYRQKLEDNDSFYV
ncbi:UNVERIFIED_CONTAM: hypothetical protein FKN15_024034 [Acipenser sinensis]